MKTQMKFQKRLCLASLILGALVIVYAALYKTGMLAALGTVCEPTNGTTRLAGAEIFYDTDPFNTALLWLGVASVLSACLLYIFANQKRRNYYISNYVISIFVAVVFIAVAIVTIIFSAGYLAQLNTLKADTAFLASWKDLQTDPRYFVNGVNQIAYSTSNAMFIIGFILCALLIVAGVFLILNMLWKRKLMQGEKELLERSYAEEVA